MRIALRALRYFPYIAHFVGARREAKLRFGNEIKHFVSRQKIAGIEINPAAAFPNDDLPHRNIAAPDNVPRVFISPALHSPFMIVKNRAGRFDDAQHLTQTFLLPSDIFRPWHTVVMRIVAVNQFRIGPFAAVFAFQSVAGGIFNVIGRRSNRQIYGFVRQPPKKFQTVISMNFIQPTRNIRGNHRPSTEEIFPKKTLLHLISAIIARF